MSVAIGEPSAARRSQVRSGALIALSAGCFGAIPIFVTLGVSAGATLLTILTWRYAIGGLLLTVASGGPGALAIPRRRWVPALLLGGGGQALVAGVSLSALRYIPAATLSFLFFTYPAWVALIAALRGTEALTRRRLGALALSFAGIAVMIGSPWSVAPHPVGVMLALASAVLYAMYVPALDHLQRGIAPTVFATYICWGALAILLTIEVATGRFTIALAPMSWLAVLGLGAISTLVGFTAFLRGLAVLGPVRTAIIATLEPFFTAVLGAVALGQALTTTTLAGGALIAGAVILVQTGPPRRGRGGTTEWAVGSGP